MKRVLVLSALALAVSAPAAEAHLGNSNYRDVINQITPSEPGLSVQVLNFDNNLELQNHTGKTVVVDGYSHEAYAQVLANGTVQVNERSPAYYLNQDRDANVTVPPSASATAPPQWVTVDKTGRFLWHDHRIHLFTTATPNQVKDKSKTTKIFDWTVPIKVGGSAGAIAGTLFWHGQSNAFPVWAPISMIAILIVAFVLVARTRRRRQPLADEREPAGAPGVREAW